MRWETSRFSISTLSSQTFAMISFRILCYISLTFLINVVNELFIANFWKNLIVWVSERFAWNVERRYKSLKTWKIIWNRYGIGLQFVPGRSLMYALWRIVRFFFHRKECNMFHETKLVFMRVFIQMVSICFIFNWEKRALFGCCVFRRTKQTLS